MTKVDLIAKVAAEAELTKKDAEKAVAAVLDGITEALKAGDKVALVGFGTFMLGGENCRNAAAAAIQSGYRMVEEAYGNEKDIDERIEKNGIDRCGDGAALRAGQKRAAHRENGNTGIGGVFADVVRGGRMKNVLLLGATGTAGSALEVACRHGMSPNLVYPLRKG